MTKIFMDLKTGNVFLPFDFGMKYDLDMSGTQKHLSHSVCVSVCICKSVFAGSRTLLDKSSIRSTPLSLKPSSFI